MAASPSVHNERGAMDARTQAYTEYAMSRARKSIPEAFFAGWDARQPEMDTLLARIRDLEAKA